MAAKKTFYITTAIDYVNADPHIGHAYQKIIADALARWHKLKGERVFYLTGTDEHGQKLVRSAEEKGKSPKEFVDETSKKFKEAWKALNIKYDRFIRTTDKDHEKFVQKFIDKIKKDIYRGEYEGYYCVGCEAYITEKELVNGECPYHPGKKVERLKEETYFFKLSKYEKNLLKIYEDKQEFILPKGRRKEIVNFVKEGLHDLSITRTNIKWGIPFPLDKNHVVYVWFEALLNYLTGGGRNQEFWPASVHLLGKDNGRFHAIIWPAMLISAGYELPKTVFIHGFLTFNGQKISKSLGNVISPKYLADKYGSDGVRYFICRNFVFGEDGDFSEKVLVERYNNELADKLGNLVSRLEGLAEKTGEIKKTTADKNLTSKLKLKEIEKKLDNYELDKGLNLIMGFIDECNKYIQEKKVWQLNGRDLNTALYTIADSLRVASILLHPFIPETAEKILKRLKEKKISLERTKFGLLGSIKIKKSDVLFKKIK